MASDYGDEAGEKMLDNFTRFGERMGERAMYDRASRMQRAFQNATRSAREAGGGNTALPAREVSPEWAKLDMAEFQGIEDYGGIKDIIEDRLGAHGVESTWFPDPQTGKEYLLFRIADAREVWQSFDELAKETDAAKEKAADAIRQRVEGRGEDREASGIEARRPAEAERGPSAKPGPAHAKTVWQKYGVPVLRDYRPLEERAAHARAASAALEAERSATARGAERGPRFQEVRSK